MGQIKALGFPVQHGNDLCLLPDRKVGVTVRLDVAFQVGVTLVADDLTHHTDVGPGFPQRSYDGVAERVKIYQGCVDTDVAAVSREVLGILGTPLQGTASST